MTARRSKLTTYGALLLLGIAVGSALDSFRLIGLVEARALDRTEVDRLYNDLDSTSRPLVEGSHFLAKVARVTTPSVVHIQSRRRGATGGTVEETGSGVVMTSPRMSGFFVVTNRHVIADARRENISIHLHDGEVIRPARIWTDKATDVAVLGVARTGLQPARWGDSDQVEIGHMVLAMGSPFGLSRSVTYGIISAKGRRSLRLGPNTEMINQDFLQTDAAINPGNSGGPLIDLHGRVIGINTAIASNSGGNDGIGFSIPSNLAQRVVDQLLANGRVERAYLGVRLDPDFGEREAERLRLARVRGARVLEVHPGTPAERAQLKFDDVILKFGSVEVQDENHLINLVSLTPINQPVRLSVYRDGRTISVDVVLSDRTELDQRSETPPPAEGAGPTVVPLGLTVHTLDHDVAAQLGLEESAAGLLVLNVDAAGPLFRDLRLYDVIEEVAGTPVATADELGRVLAEHADRETLLLKVRRRVNGHYETHLVLGRRG